MWCAIYPKPGGEPLWIAPEDPVIFVSARPWPQISWTGGSRERFDA